MEITEGLKSSEIGSIPVDWEVEPLWRLSSDIGDGIHATPTYVENSDYFFINGNNLNGWKISITEDTKCISKNEFEKYKVGLGNKTILLSINGTIGNIAFYEEEKVILGKSAAYINLKREVDKKFVFYILDSFATKTYFENELTGSTIRNLSLYSLRNTPIPLPNIDEQHAIAEALSDVDELISSLDALIAKKRAIKQGVIQELLTGKRRLPGFKGEWEQKKLGDLGICLRGVSYKGDEDLYDSDNEFSVRLLRSNNVQKGVLDQTDYQFVNVKRVKQFQYLLENDIVICMANGSKQLVGKAALFNINDNYRYTYGAFMGCFRTNPKLANSIFISNFFQSNQYRLILDKLLSGSSINNLTPSSIESIDLSIPNLVEQNAISDIFQDYDFEIMLLDQKRRKLSAIIAGMMQELLTGRIRLMGG